MKFTRTALLAAALLCSAHAIAEPLLDTVVKGTTSYTANLKIIDSADGTPETAVAFNTSGIDLEYCREGAACTDITEATLSALTDAWSSGGFLTKGHGNYRIDLPDAALASSAGIDWVDVQGTVTGMIVLGGRIRLTGINQDDATRGGMTALPNAAAEAAGGLYTRGTGAGQINQPANGRVDTGVIAWGGTLLATTNPLPTVAAGANGGLPTGDASGRVQVQYGTSTGQFSCTAGVCNTNFASATDGSIAMADFAVAPGAAGGFLIAGTNADFNVTSQVNFADGLDLVRSTSNGSAFTMTGNGTGHGMLATSGSGATGDGARFLAASTNGNGWSAQGTGTGSGGIGTGGPTGDGVEGIGGSSSGSGLRGAGTAGNSPGVAYVGQGSAPGESATGGATGPGMLLTGGSTSGLGFATSITSPSGSVLELGMVRSGTLSGTHSTTTADLGANAPTRDISCMVVYFADHDLPKLIQAYNTGTGVVTFAVTTETLVNGDDWYLYGTPCGVGDAPTAAEIWTHATRELTSGNNIALAKGTGVTGFTDLSATGVENAVLNGLLSGHTTSGTVGERLGRVPNAAAGGTGGLPTVDSTNRVAGVSGNVAGSVASVTGNVSGSVGSVAGNVSGNVTGNVGGSVGSLGTTAKTNVETAATAALNALTIDGELLIDLLCRVASGMYGAQATDLTANGGNGQSVFSNAAGSEIRFTVNYGTDAGDRSSVSLGSSCGN